MVDVVRGIRFLVSSGFEQGIHTCQFKTIDCIGLAFINRLRRVEDSVRMNPDYRTMESALCDVDLIVRGRVGLEVVVVHVKFEGIKQIDVGVDVVSEEIAKMIVDKKELEEVKGVE
ncbi:hypothetical protein Tco_0439838 [Tanacetum coccineum]